MRKASTGVGWLPEVKLKFRFFSYNFFNNKISIFYTKKLFKGLIKDLIDMFD